MCKKKTPEKRWAKVRKYDERSNDSSLKTKERNQATKKKVKTAKKALKHASEHKDAIPYWLNQSIGFFLNGDLDNANKACQKALAIDPQAEDNKTYWERKIEELAGENYSHVTKWFFNMALPMIQEKISISGNESNLESATFEDFIQDPNEDNSKKDSSKGKKIITSENPHPSTSNLKFFNTSQSVRVASSEDGDNTSKENSSPRSAIKPRSPSQTARRLSHS